MICKLSECAVSADSRHEDRIDGDSEKARENIHCNMSVIGRISTVGNDNEYRFLEQDSLCQ